MRRRSPTVYALSERVRRPLLSDRLFHDSALPMESGATQRHESGLPVRFVGTGGHAIKRERSTDK